VEEYDIVSDTVKALPGLFVARDEMGLEAVNGKLYLIYGHDGSKYLNTIDEYRLDRAQWETAKQEMPVWRQGQSSVEVNGKIYIRWSKWFLIYKHSRGI
jgi:Kelch motif